MPLPACLNFAFVAILQAQATVGAIEGVVRDSAGDSIPYATIRAMQTTYGALTDAHGHYRIQKVPPGVLSLRVLRLGYSTATVDSVVVTAGSVTHQDFVLAPGARARRAVRIPCPAGQPSPGGGSCVHARFVGSLDDAPSGVGLIRDRATWNVVRRRFGQRRRTDVSRDSSRIHWDHEMVLLLSYGRGLAEMEESWGFNRAEVRSDTLVITLGPDSLVGKREIYADGFMFPDAFALPRSNLPVRFEKPVPDGWIPPEVDWRLVADTAAKR